MSAAAERSRVELRLDATLTLVILLLAVARLFGAHGYGTYKPIGMQLLEGWPAAWESVYFVEHVPTFLADAPSRLGIAPVDYRTYIQLYLFTQLYGWTGSAYWSLAAVDLLFWVVATVCTLRLGLRLGLAWVAAFIGALLTAGSSMFAAQMWRQDLHLANLASLPMGLWAAVTLMQEHRSRLRLVVGLAAVLVFLSLTYQYQWFVAPVALTLMAFESRIGWRIAPLVVGGAAVMAAAATAALQVLLTFSGLGPTPERMGAVQQPLAAAAEVFGPSAFGSGIFGALPGVAHVTSTATAYHPVVYVLGLAGLALLGARGVMLGVLAFALPLLFMRLHPPPWVAMTAYPLIYLGAGHSCALVGGVMPRAMGRGLAIAAAVVLLALTNGDLWGDTRFLLAWWNVYHPVPIH